MTRNLNNDFNISEERYVIFASDESASYTREFLDKCGIGYKVLQGRYKGEDETSYIINKHNEYMIAPLIEQQESVLELTSIGKSGNRRALLKLHTGQIIPLGEFVHASVAEAQSAEAYTFDPATQTYYVAR